jgi:hypothetical protein
MSDTLMTATMEAAEATADQPLDLPATVAKIIDELAAARAAGNSLVDHHKAIVAQLDMLMVHQDEIKAMLPEPEPAPAPEPAAEPVAAESAYGSDMAPERPMPATEA